MQRESTAQELAELRQFAKEGFNLTPEMLEHIRTQFFISPLMETLPDRIIENLAVTVMENGKIIPVIQVTNPNLVDTRWKPENPEFSAWWNQQHMKLSVNTVHGFLSFMTHGIEAQLKPYITQPLKPYDVENLLEILYAKWLAQRDESYVREAHTKRWKLPTQQRFPAKMRKHIQKYLDEFKAIEKAKEQVENEN